MLGEPLAKDLVAAVAGYLEGTVLPRLEGHAAFHGKVALNVLAIVTRELELGPAAAAEEASLLRDILGTDEANLPGLRAALCDRLRAGTIDAAAPGLLERLERIAAARVRIEQPGYASLARADFAQNP